MSILDTLPKSARARNPQLAKVASKSASHTKSAKTAQKRGASFEDDVEAALKSLVREGVVADYTRNDARKKERGGKVIARIANGCDFTGVLARGCRGFAIECKSGAVVYPSPEHAAIAKRSRAPAITRRQREQLDAYRRAGGVALLAVRSDGIPCLLPWACAHDVIEVTAAFVRAWHDPRNSLYDDLRARLAA